MHKHQRQQFDLMMYQEPVPLWLVRSDARTMALLRQRNTMATIAFTFIIVAVFSIDTTNAYISAPLPRQKSSIPSKTIFADKNCCRSTKATTRLHIANLPSDDGSGLSYAERSRPYRRDVFDSDEWVRVRSAARFSTNLLSIFQSGIVRQLLNEAIFISGVATFLCLYNALLVNGYDDFSGIHHDPFGQGFYEFSLPSIFFTLTSPALSLLLGKSACDVNQ
jgi:hypothetical protein